MIPPKTGIKDARIQEMPMTRVEEMAAFVERISYDDLSGEISRQIKIRVLDALGCALGALEAEPMRMIKNQIKDFNGAGLCTLIGGGRTAPDRAAFYNSALVRYLDFSDAYLAKGETCHPSDNLGAILAASEYAKRSGQDLMTALAIAYQVQCRLSDLAPLRSKGFDHTTQGSYAVAAGVSKALGLDRNKTANAIAICGTAFNALRVARTGALSNWKGLAYPNTAFGCTHGTFLAMRGITGPLEVFEGNKGFMEAIAGRFEINWLKEDLERVTQTILKRFNSEIHSQSVLEGILEMRQEYALNGQEIEKMEIEIFDVAYHIIGGGEEGDKTIVRTKEEADHSLPYLAAVAILDGQVMPEQYRPVRIRSQDVQALLRKVTIKPSAAYSQRFPEEMPCRIIVTLLDGRILIKEKRDYEGFRTRPMSWETAVKKFEELVSSSIKRPLCRRIIDAVSHLDSIQVSELTQWLGEARRSPT
jgi:2-methylcitrate dehydratase